MRSAAPRRFRKLASAQKADGRLPVGCQLLSDNRRMREYHAWAGEPATGVWTFSALLNPERMRSLSPGLRAARYRGWATGWGVNPERAASFVPFTGVNPTHTFLALQVLENASEIVVQFMPERGIAQQRTAVFSGEDRMHENPGQ